MRKTQRNKTVNPLCQAKMSIESGIILYNLIFRPHLTSRTNTNSIRDLVKSYCGYGIPSPKVFVLAEKYKHKIKGLYWLYHDKNSKCYKKLRKENNLRGRINIYVEYDHDFSKLVKNIKPLDFIGKYYNDKTEIIPRGDGFQPVKTDIFVICKNEDDNYCDSLSYVEKHMQKRRELYKKVEYDVMFKNKLNSYKNNVVYNLIKMKEMNSSIYLNQFINDVIKTYKINEIKQKKFGKESGKVKNSIFGYDYYTKWKLLD